MTRKVLVTVDIASASVVAGLSVIRALAKAISIRPADTPRRRTVVVLENDYSLATIRRLGFEDGLTARDLDGFFDHVWIVHPAVGASTEEPPQTAVGPPASTDLDATHTVLEGRVAYSPRLTSLPTLNFVVSQTFLIERLNRLIRTECVSLVIATDPFYLGALGLLLSKCNRLPLVIRLIANYDGQFYGEGRPAYPRLFRRRSLEKKLDRFLLRRADLVAAGNNDILQYALANGAQPDRSTVFPIGTAIEPQHFSVAPAERPSVKHELGFGDRPLIVCVGRLEQEKHPEDVLRLLARPEMRERGVAGMLIGDGSLRNDLEAMARHLAVDGDIFFAGSRDQAWLANAMSCADAVVSPVTGRALVEAMLSGTPVVAYDVDWQGEVVHHEDTGLLVPYRDTEKLAAAVARLIDEPDWASALGAQARRVTMDVMDPQRLRENERRHYRKLLGDVAPSPAPARV